MDFSHLSQEFAHLFTSEWLLALLNIIIIDIVMSWDNAIVIGMATNKLPAEQRKKAIMIWVVWATLLRIIFAISAVWLMKIIGIQLVWWLLLLYVVWKFYTEIRKGGHEEHIDSSKNPNSLSQAIMLIILADVSMSLDNVLAVAWAAKENIVILGIWLIFSILMMAFASNFIAKKLNDYPQIQWVWLLVILFVAIEMMLHWVEKIDWSLNTSIPLINFFGVLIFWLLTFAIAWTKKLPDMKFDFFHQHKKTKWLLIVASIAISILAILSLFHIIDPAFLHWKIQYLYGLFMIAVVFWLEYFWTSRKPKVANLDTELKDWEFRAN